MKKKIEFTVCELKEVLRYDYQTGIFYRKTKTWKRNVGDIADFEDKHSKYRIVCAFSSRFHAHRLAFFYMTGRWPQKGFVVDHINRNKSDNRWENLREVSRSENAINTDPEKASKNKRKRHKWNGYYDFLKTKQSNNNCLKEAK